MTKFGEDIKKVNEKFEDTVKKVDKKFNEIISKGVKDMKSTHILK